VLMCGMLKMPHIKRGSHNLRDYVTMEKFSGGVNRRFEKLLVLQYEKNQILS